MRFCYYESKCKFLLQSTLQTNHWLLKKLVVIKFGSMSWVSNICLKALHLHYGHCCNYSIFVSFWHWGVNMELSELAPVPHELKLPLAKLWLFLTEMEIYFRIHTSIGWHKNKLVFDVGLTTWTWVWYQSLTKLALKS